MSSKVAMRNEFLQRFKCFFESFKQSDEELRLFPSMSNICQNYIRQRVPGVTHLYVELRVKKEMVTADTAIYVSRLRCSKFDHFRHSDEWQQLGLELSEEELHATPSGLERHLHTIIPISSEVLQWNECFNLIAEKFQFLIRVLQVYGQWLEAGNI